MKLQRRYRTLYLRIIESFLYNNTTSIFGRDCAVLIICEMFVLSFSFFEEWYALKGCVVSS